jgi:hypothetical protein
MADTAAHLLDRVFPRVPVRQWVLSFPHALRLAYDSNLVTGVLHIFMKTVFDSLIDRAREFGVERNAQCGAVSFIQRFGSALNLNLHMPPFSSSEVAFRAMGPLHKTHSVTGISPALPPASAVRPSLNFLRS